MAKAGNIIGAPLKGRVLILDDVITAGTAIGEAATIIRSVGATPAGVIVSLDREEVGGASRLSAIQEVQQQLSVPVRAIVTLTDLIEHLEGSAEFGSYLPAVRAYRNRYGVTRAG